MSIGRKFTGAFLLIAVIPTLLISLLFTDMAQIALRRAVADNFQSLAHEKANAITRVVESGVIEAKNLALHPSVIEAVRQANHRYDGMSDDKARQSITVIDREWIEAKKTAASEAILNNNLSRFLRTVKDRNAERFGEVFVTDVKGATVAMTKTLTDYYQADEGWWSAGYNGGKGGIFIDDRGNDLSAQAVVLGVVTPVTDGGKVIGILKINFRVAEILHIISPGDKDREAERVFLARSQGTIIVDSKGPPGLPGLQDKRTDDGGGKRGKITGHAPIRADISTRIQAPGAVREISGEKWERSVWTVFIEMDENTAFAEIRKGSNRLLAVAGVITLLAALSAVWSSRAFSRPIRKLHKDVEAISAGNLDHRADSKTSDEIGDLGQAFNLMTGRLKEATTSRDELHREVSERALMERAARENEERLRAIINASADDYMAFWDAAGKLQFANFSPSEELTTKTREVTAGKARLRFEAPYGERWFDYNYNPVVSTGGEVHGVVMFARDVTERREIERQLRHSQKVESLGNLAGGIAHDLNNMLFPILTLTGMTIKRLPEESPERERLGKVVQAAERAKSLVARILTFSRQEEVVQETICLGEAIRQIMPLIQSTLPATIDLKFHLGAKDCIVLADTGQIETLLINLVSNSVDAMKGKIGGIDISLKRIMITAKSVGKLQGLKPGPWAKLTVRDTGCGMDEATMERLFDPFFTTKGVGMGTGLGLSMVHGIVTKHGGVIDVSSRPGEGAAFDIYFPLVKSANI